MTVVNGQAAGERGAGPRRSASVFFVGNRLMLDEGIGPAAFDEMQKLYDIPENRAAVRRGVHVAGHAALCGAL